MNTENGKDDDIGNNNNVGIIRNKNTNKKTILKEYY